MGNDVILEPTGIIGFDEEGNLFTVLKRTNRKHQGYTHVVYALTYSNFDAPNFLIDELANQGASAARVLNQYFKALK